MDFWQRAKSFAEEAAKKSQELTQEAAKRTQELTRGTKISDIVSETAKKSKELAAEASKKADQIKTEALKRADQIKSLAEGIEPPNLFDSSSSSSDGPSESDLKKFGVTDELREFVKGITQSTFKDFPMEDEPETSDVSTVSNVRQDLTEWQERHATLVLLTVKEISKLRYQLCPRVMKERKFWKIYFILVNSHVAPYEKQYMEEIKLKLEEEKVKDDELKENAQVETTPTKPKGADPSGQLKTATSSAEQDLDVFLLGDLGSSDEGQDDGDVGEDGFDDDFDKIVDNSDDEDDKQLK